MNKLVLVMVVAAAAAALSCNNSGSSGSGGSTAGSSSAALSPSAAGAKQTWIHFTKNYNRGTGAGQYDTPCVATVSTEQIGARGGYMLMWHVEPNGGNDDDKCPSLDVQKVSLHFVTDVMGAGAMKVLKPNPGGVIEGKVSENDSDIGSLLVHKYQVYLEDKPAGPDPVIIVNCSECGPPPPKP